MAATITVTASYTTSGGTTPFVSTSSELLPASRRMALSDRGGGHISRALFPPSAARLPVDRVG